MSDDDDAPESTREPRPLGYVAAAGWTLAAFVLFGVAAAATQALRPGAATDLVSLGISQLLSYSLVLFAMLRVHEPEGSIRRFVGLGGGDARVLVLAVALGAGLYPFSELFDGWVAKRHPLTPEQAELALRIMDVSTLPRKAGVVAVLLVILPVCEELFFRGAVFGGLARATNARSAAIATVGLDVLAHPDPRLLPSVLALSCTLSWLRLASGGIGAPLLAHVVHTAIPLGLMFAGREDIGGRALALGGAAYVLGLGATIAVFRARTRRA
jgi:membrane protease YdiL (CAAX protease family)